MQDRCSIKPVPIDPNVESSFDYTAYTDIEKINDTKFKILHKQDRSQDLIVTLEIDEED